MLSDRGPRRLWSLFTDVMRSVWPSQIAGRSDAEYFFLRTRDVLLWAVASRSAEHSLFLLLVTGRPNLVTVSFIRRLRVSEAGGVHFVKV
jgi:hypothetical protein